MKTLAVFLVLLLISPVARTQVTGSPSGDQILQKIEDGFIGLNDYTVDLDVTVDLERLKVPPMHVTMYFKKPDKVHFSSDGFALLPREGVALSTQRLRSRYSIEAVRKDTLNGESVQVLTLKSKADKSKLHEILLYVSPEHWTPTRFVSPLSDGRTMTASFEYRSIDRHWLPSLLLVEFASGPSDTIDYTVVQQMSPARRSQPARNGTITIRYSNYRLNEGLSDEIFDRKAVGSGRE